ncbi:MAG: hypothetical protein JO162_13035 [Alphaproteobacteria bacterium]|nr:hypothetical protein [Alphaproteobacteria bacterium]
MSDPAPEPPPTDPLPTQRPAPVLSGRRGAIVIGIATALIVFGLLVMTGPFWAPAVLPLLTGGGPKSPEPALADRLAQVEAVERDNQQKANQAIAAAQKNAGDTGAALQQIERRIAALESKSAASPADIAELHQQVKALETRPTPSPPDLDDIRQQLQQLAAATGDLKNRVAALEKNEQAQGTTDPTDTALLLAVLQMREAIETARPFVVEYDALAALAKSRPEIAAAAAPLADAAKSGVASRAVLIERLRALAGAIATAKASPAPDNWGGRAWAQLRGLVTIRRVDGAGQSASEAAVSTAERSLAAGDLTGAVAALDALTGPAAEAARPWLQMARQRLAVETALHQVETPLIARLGTAR